MNKLSELTMKLNSLNADIKEVLEYSKFRDYEDLSALDYNKNAEDLLLIEEYRILLDKLDYVSNEIEYLKRPIKEEGTLYLNELGRYQIKGSNTYYSSGYGIEFLTYDDYKDCYCWHTSTVEHNGKDYYIVGYPSVELNGLKVRVRR